MHERGLGIHILGNNQHVLTAQISRALVHAGLVLLNIWGGRDLASQNSVFFEEVIQAQGLHELMVLLPPKVSYKRTQAISGQGWSLFKGTIELGQVEIPWSVLVVNSMLLKYHNIAWHLCSSDFKREKKVY